MALPLCFVEGLRLKLRTITISYTSSSLKVLHTCTCLVSELKNYNLDFLSQHTKHNFFYPEGRQRGSKISNFILPVKNFFHSVRTFRSNEVAFLFFSPIPFFSLHNKEFFFLSYVTCAMLFFY